MGSGSYLFTHDTISPSTYTSKIDVFLDIRDAIFSLLGPITRSVSNISHSPHGKTARLSAECPFTNFNSSIPAPTEPFTTFRVTSGCGVRRLLQRT
ncbi:hypothetical protein WG66_002374 [Moniliophthora roreri]|nr:hypothetical protein WG66_002374 [Moniliophthora roreri]